MKKKLSIIGITILLGITLSGLMQLASHKPAYALPCCNNYGWHLCDPNSSWWRYETWSCQPSVGPEIEISNFDCRLGWTCPGDSCWTDPDPIEECDWNDCLL
jgi:hypothetical protein